MLRLKAVAVAANRGQHHNGGVAQREPGPYPARALALLHHLAGDVINGGDVVGIHRVTQAVAPGQQAGRHQRRGGVKQVKRGPPGDNIGDDQGQHQRHGFGLIIEVFDKHRDIPI